MSFTLSSSYNLWLIQPLSIPLFFVWTNPALLPLPPVRSDMSQLGGITIPFIWILNAADKWDGRLGSPLKAY